jgi:hypothetical protein
MTVVTLFWTSPLIITGIQGPFLNLGVIKKWDMEWGKWTTSNIYKKQKKRNNNLKDKQKNLRKWKQEKFCHWSEGCKPVKEKVNKSKDEEYHLLGYDAV